MYDIIFNCPNCGVELEASSSGIGTVIECPQCAGGIAVPNVALEEGLEFGEFVLQKQLGVGGMGEVWLAWQNSMHRHVAVKILRPKLSGNERFIKHFMREVEMIGQLQHPNIISAYTAGKVGDIYYLATSFVKGQELADKLRCERRFSEITALKMASTIAQALKYAWDTMKLVHRDIKPQNIMVDEKNVPYVMDMGISKVTDRAEATGEANVVAGTPGYMSPEQAKATGDVDFRSDIFSLGITLFQLLTGDMPQERSDFAIESRKYPPQVSRHCRRLLAIMTERKPQSRQSSWDYVIGDIKLVLNGRDPLEYGGRKKSNDSEKIDSLIDKKMSLDTERPVKLKYRQSGAEEYTSSETTRVEKMEATCHELHESTLSAPPPKLFSKKKHKKGLIIIAVLEILIIIAMILFYFLKK